MVEMDEKKNIKALNIYKYTYEEAVEVLMPKRIKGVKEYREECRKNPRLQFNPNKSYKGKGWKGYDIYLSKYYTLDEVKRIIEENNIDAVDKYKLHRKKDKRLPLKTKKLYGIEIYDLVKKIRKATDVNIILKFIRDNNVTSKSHYRSIYKKCPEIPADPSQREGWPGWPVACSKLHKKGGRRGVKKGNKYVEPIKEDNKAVQAPADVQQAANYYPNKKQAKYAAYRKGIRSYEDYKMNHAKDPRLPPNLQEYYKLSDSEMNEFFDIKELLSRKSII